MVPLARIPGGGGIEGCAGPRDAYSGLLRERKPGIHRCDGPLHPTCLRQWSRWTQGWLTFSKLYCTAEIALRTADSVQRTAFSVQRTAFGSLKGWLFVLDATFSYAVRATRYAVRNTTLSGAGADCFRGLYEVSLALVGVASPAYFQY